MSGYEASAPLTGTLLSNKGAAAPSNSVASLLDDLAVEALAVVRPAPRVAQPPNAGSAKRSPVADGTHQDTPCQSAPETILSASRERIKLSLRLSVDQHLRLKLAAAHLRQSSQTLLMAALDDYLAKCGPGVRNGECNCLMSGSVDKAAPYHGKPSGNAD